MPTFALPENQYKLTSILQLLWNAPLPLSRFLGKNQSFGGMLMPGYYPCTAARLVSCYALFK